MSDTPKPEALERIAQQMADAVKVHLRRLLDPLTTRLSTVETRIGALSMMRGAPGARDEQAHSQLQSLEARLATLEAWKEAQGQ